MIPQKVYQKLLSGKKSNKKQVAILIDPDKVDDLLLKSTIQIAENYGVDFLFVGGSLLYKAENFLSTIQSIKNQSNTPIVIFPGSNLQISSDADALLLLSLISGRNADLLIGQHVIAAPYLKESGIEIISVGYMLIDCGKQTTASYISGSMPIPYNKPEIAACTAMAGEMLGNKVIYLDGGSGAEKTISHSTIEAVAKSIEIPLIVGGGIRSGEDALGIFKAGADLIVIGNAVEKDPSLIAEICHSSKAII